MGIIYHVQGAIATSFCRTTRPATRQRWTAKAKQKSRATPGSLRPLVGLLSVHIILHSTAALARPLESYTRISRRKHVGQKHEEKRTPVFLPVLFLPSFGASSCSPRTETEMERTTKNAENSARRSRNRRGIAAKRRKRRKKARTLFCAFCAFLRQSSSQPEKDLEDSSAKNRSAGHALCPAPLSRRHLPALLCVLCVLCGSSPSPRRALQANAKATEEQRLARG